LIVAKPDEFPLPGGQTFDYFPDLLLQPGLLGCAGLLPKSFGGVSEFFDIFIHAG